MWIALIHLGGGELEPIAARRALERDVTFVVRWEFDLDNRIVHRACASRRWNTGPPSDPSAPKKIRKFSARRHVVGSAAEPTVHEEEDDKHVSRSEKSCL
jgi:hypothetical protein